jgi:hypothetical protein
MNTTKDQAAERKATRFQGKKPGPKPKQAEAAKEAEQPAQIAKPAEGDVILSKEQYEELVQAANAKRTVNPFSHIPKRKMDTADEEYVPDRKIDIPLTGSMIDYQPPEIEVIDGPDPEALGKELAFMEEFMVIEVPSTGLENEEDPFGVGVNGRMIAIPRDVPVRIRRKYVERLARAKQSNYTQKKMKVIDPETYNSLAEKTGIVYNFTVMDWGPDPKRAQDWLKKVLRQRQ